jgi:hypothetical protein
MILVGCVPKFLYLGTRHSLSPTVGESSEGGPATVLVPRNEPMLFFTPHPIIYPNILLMQLRMQFVLYIYRKLIYLYVKTMVLIYIKKFEIIPRFYFNI